MFNEMTNWCVVFSQIFFFTVHVEVFCSHSEQSQILQSQDSTSKCNYYVTLEKSGEMWLDTQPMCFGIFSHDLKIIGIRGRATHKICGFDFSLLPATCKFMLYFSSNSEWVTGKK